MLQICLQGGSGAPPTPVPTLPPTPVVTVDPTRVPTPSPSRPPTRVPSPSPTPSPTAQPPPLPSSNLDEPTMTVEPLPLVAVPRTHQCFEGEKKARVTSRALCPLSVGVDCLVAHAHTSRGFQQEILHPSVSSISTWQCSHRTSSTTINIINIPKICRGVRVIGVRCAV